MSSHRDHLDIESLSALIDGQAEGGSRAAIEAHLASCAQCAARKSALESAVRAVAALDRPGPTPAEAATLRRAVLERARPSAAGAGVGGAAPAGRGAGSWRRRLSWRVYAAGGAVVAVVAGLGGYLVLGQASLPSASTAAGAARHGQNALAPSPSPAAPAFTSDAGVQAYVAAQPGLTQRARSLTSLDAPAATNGFFAALVPAAPAAPAASTGQAAPTGQAAAASTAPAPAAALPSPQATAAVPTNAAGGAPYGNVNPLPAGQAAPTGAAASALAGCLRTVLAGLPKPAVPLETVTITYQGIPAWLLIFASAPATASPAPPGSALSREEIWVQSQGSCTTLDHSAVTP